MTSGHLEIETEVRRRRRLRPARPGRPAPASRPSTRRWSTCSRPSTTTPTTSGCSARGSRCAAAPAARTPAGTSSCRPERARRELHAPLGRASKNPPGALREPVTGILRGAPDRPGGDAAHPAAGHGAPRRRRPRLAEVADDTVTATARRGPRRCRGGARRGARSRWSSATATRRCSTPSGSGSSPPAPGRRPSASKIGRVLAGPARASATCRPARTSGRRRGSSVRGRTDASRWPHCRRPTSWCAPSSPTPSTRCACPRRRLRSILAAFRPVAGPDGDRPAPRGAVLARRGAVRRPGRRGGAGAPAGPGGGRAGGARPRPGGGPTAAGARSASRRAGLDRALRTLSEPRYLRAAGRPVRAARRPAVRRRRRGTRSAPVLRRRPAALRAAAPPSTGRPRAGARRGRPRRSRCTTSARRPSGSATPPRSRPASSDVARHDARRRRPRRCRRRSARCRTPWSPASTAAGSGSRRPPRGRTPSPTAGCTPSSRPAPSGPSGRSGPHRCRGPEGLIRRSAGTAGPPGVAPGRGAAACPTARRRPVHRRPARLRHRRPARDAAAARLPLVAAGPQHDVPGPAATPADAAGRRAGAAPGAGGGPAPDPARSTRPPRWTGSPTSGSASPSTSSSPSSSSNRCGWSAASCSAGAERGSEGTAERGPTEVEPSGARRVPRRRRRTAAPAERGNGTWPRCRPGGRRCHSLPPGGSSSPAGWPSRPVWSRSARRGRAPYFANSPPVVRRVPVTLAAPRPGAGRAADRHLLRRAPVGDLRRPAVRAAGRARQRAAAGRRGDRRRPGRRRASRSCARTSRRWPTWSASRASSSSPATTSTSSTPAPGCGTCRRSAWTCCATSGCRSAAAAASFDLAGIDDRTAARSGVPGHGADLDAALDGRDDATPVVLLAHQPVHGRAGAARPGSTCSCPATRTAVSCGPSTTRSGWTSPSVEGLSRHGDTQLYVTSRRRVLGAADAGRRPAGGHRRRAARPQGLRTATAQIGRRASNASSTSSSSLRSPLQSAQASRPAVYADM